MSSRTSLSPKKASEQDITINRLLSKEHIKRALAQPEHPKITLQWEGLGPENNVNGYCFSGELFAFIGRVNNHKNILQKLAFPQLEYKDSPKPHSVYYNGQKLQHTAPNFTYLKMDYVDQLYDNLTVLETLIFSTDLRIDRDSGDVFNELAESRALRLLTETGLKDIGEMKLSELPVWKKQMVLIATEVIAKREVIFFPKPTADLEARAAVDLLRCLQLIAASGCVVIITATDLSFREYCILDRIQLLSSTGAIYFGLQSSAVAYFAELAKFPPPGTTIPDFLVDLVEDAPLNSDMKSMENYCEVLGTFINESSKRSETSHPLRRRWRGDDDDLMAPIVPQYGYQGGEMVVVPFAMNENNKQRSPIRRDINLTGESEPNTSSSSSNSTKDYAMGAQAVVTAPETVSPLHIEGRKSVSPSASTNQMSSYIRRSSNGRHHLTYDALEEGTQSFEEYSFLHDEHIDNRKSSLNHKEKWFMSCDCLEEEEETMFCEIKPMKQFLWLCWRAFIVRLRKYNQLFAVWMLAGIFISIGLALAFFQMTTDFDEFEDKITFLTILPFSIVLMSSLWNEYDHKDRQIFIFERHRNYYYSPLFLLTSLLADVVLYKIAPPVIAGVILYPIVGLRPEWSRFLLFLETLSLLSVVGACQAKALFSVMSNFPQFTPISASMATSFLISMQVLYTGALANLAKIEGFSGFMKNISFFYWGCNLLYWNEMEGVTLTNTPRLLGEITGEDMLNKKYIFKIPTNYVFLALWLQITVYVILYLTIGLCFYRNWKYTITIATEQQHRSSWSTFLLRISQFLFSFTRTSEAQ